MGHSISLYGNEGPPPPWNGSQYRFILNEGLFEKGYSIALYGNEGSTWNGSQYRFLWKMEAPSSENLELSKVLFWQPWNGHSIALYGNEAPPEMGHSVTLYGNEGPLFWKHRVIKCSLLTALKWVTVLLCMFRLHDRKSAFLSFHLFSNSSSAIWCVYHRASQTNLWFDKLFWPCTFF